MEKLFENVSYRRKLFGAIGGFVTIFALLSCDYNSMIFIMAAVSSAILYFRLPYASCCIENRWTRFGWACFDFSIFLGLSTLLSAISSEGIKFYGFAILAYLFVNAFIYSIIIPWISKKVNLEDDKIINTKQNTKINGVVGCFILGVLFLYVEDCAYHRTEMDVLLTKEEFVPVTSWKIINRRGCCKYIVKTQQGTYMIPLKEYPEIANINKNTQIRVLDKVSSAGGFLLYETFRIEIKN